MDQYRVVFAALDEGPTQREVADRAIAIAEESGAEIVFGHVAVAEEGDVDAVDDAKSCIHSILARQLVRGRSSARIPRVAVEVVAGSIESSLIEKLIVPCHADLVVCGDHGAPETKVGTLGSTARHLVLSAPCDVLVVKPR